MELVLTILGVGVALIALRVFAAFWDSAFWDYPFWTRQERNYTVETLSQRTCPVCRNGVFGLEAAQKAAAEFRAAIRHANLRLDRNEFGPPRFTFDTPIELKPVWLIICPECRTTFLYAVTTEEFSRPLTSESERQWHEKIGMPNRRAGGWPDESG